MKSFFLFLSFFSLYAAAQDSTANTPKTDSVEKKAASVNIPATYPLGEKAWKKFLDNNVHPSAATDNGAPPGIYTVTVSYVIDTTGKVTDIQILQDPGYNIAYDVVRVLKKSPNWIPATQNGRKVRYRQKQNLTYEVSEH